MPSFERTLLCGFAALGPTTLARAQCAEWSDHFGTNGAAGQVRALESFDVGGGPRLFVGGGFLWAGDVETARVASWNGSAFAHFGSGLSGACCGNYEARTAAVFDHGSGPELYVGGFFQTAGGVIANHVARWNGASWSSLAFGVGSLVYDMVVFDDGSGPALYVAGAFSSTSTATAKGIARWDGTSWSALGAGTSSDPLLEIRALAVYDNGSGPALYAGGRITNLNGTPLSHLARWNGTAWSSVGAGMDGVVHALHVHDDGSGPALFIGGNFDIAGGLVIAHSVAKLQGATWSALGGGTDLAVAALATFDDGSGPALFAGGHFTLVDNAPLKALAKWDGSSWSSVGGGLTAEFNPNVEALEVLDGGSGPELFVGGAFRFAGPVAVNNVARYDGTSWSALADGGAGANDTVYAATTADLGDGDKLYIGGTFTAIGTTPIQRLASWDGATWSEVGGGVMPSAGATVFALLAHDFGGGTELYVGSSSGAAGWDGQSWSTLNSGSMAVNDFTVFDDGSGPALIAGGNMLQAGGVSVRHVAKWNGATWSALGSNLTSPVRALAVYDSGSGPTLYACGDFGLTPGAPAVGIARWNGFTWLGVGGGVDGIGTDLYVHDDGSGSRLYLLGSFAHAGPISANRIARWNGTAWSALGSGLSLAGNAYFGEMLAFDDGTGGGEALVVASGFSTAGGSPANMCAKWNGTSWSAFGGGIVAQTGFDVVAALAAYDDGDGLAPDLFMVGRFAKAGGMASSNIAAWRGCPPPLGTPYCFGDASGTICPCGNTSPNGAGQGCSHSGGAGAVLAAEGSPSVALDDHVFTVSSMPPNKSCVLFAGTAQINGGAGVRFGDGLRCAGPSVRRLGVRTSDVNGVASWGPGLSSLGYWAGGDTRHFQVWFRDSGGPCGTGTNLSSALAVAFTN